MRAALLLACLPAAALAAPVRLPLAIPGTFTFAAPPAGFEPRHATAAELEAYGFPPRPPAATRARATWELAMAHARIRVAPDLRITDHRGRPMQAAAVPGVPGQAYSGNWSGIALVNYTGQFGATSFTQAAAVFNVPIAEPPYGVCNGAVYSSTWVGIDGWTNGPDVFQAGTESDDDCLPGNNNLTHYYAWVEWYPAYQMALTNLPITPGDAVAVFIHATSATAGQLLVEDLTTNQYGIVGLNAPTGIVLSGRSAEWIIEAPQVNSKGTNLSNYVTSWITSQGAAINGQWYDFGFAPPNNVSYTLTMLDNSNNALSTASWVWPNAAVMNTTGSAR